MKESQPTSLTIHRRPALDGATLVLAFTGWMDGGDVSTGTVKRLVHLLGAKPFADIDPEPYYIYNFPGSMEIAALFRPRIEIEEGLVKSVEMPINTFYSHDEADLVPPFVIQIIHVGAVRRDLALKRALGPIGQLPQQAAGHVPGV